MSYLPTSHKFIFLQSMSIITLVLNDIHWVFIVLNPMFGGGVSEATFKIFSSDKFQERKSHLNSFTYLYINIKDAVCFYLTCSSLWPYNLKAIRLSNGIFGTKYKPFWFTFESKWRTWKRLRSTCHVNAPAEGSQQMKCALSQARGFVNK